METVAQPPADDELHLLTEWGDPASRSRTRRAGVLSVLAHAAVIVTVAVMPADIIKEQEVARRVTPLIEPVTELTQKAPNTAKVGKEFRAEVRPRLQLPEPPSPPVMAPRQALKPPVPPPKRPQPVPLPDAPVVVPASPKDPAKTDLALLAPSSPPPQIQTEEKKGPFETPGAPREPGPGRLRGPDTSVAEAIRQTVRGSNPGRPPIAGDRDGLGPSVPGSSGDLPQLLSDPMGVDFRPYLTQILAIVRRNWFSVYPESARLGMRGRVGVQFAIARSGSVTKVVYAAQSGTQALDQAAIAAISMSNPFPALPSDFKGDRVVLQFNFAYNMPKQ